MANKSPLLRIRASEVSGYIGKNEYVEIDMLILKLWKNMNYESLQKALKRNSLEIKELNKMYRNMDKATDVLSFPMDEDILVPMPLLGDIIISIETAREQANELGHSLNREICYLIAHSMFHLMGYDHMEEEEKKEMRLKEKQVMKDIGIFKAREEE